MALVRDWRRQAARAAGATLIFPVALLAMAALLAAGGGLGGLGSLGQITSGPQLPATEVAAPAARGGTVESAGIVAADPAPAPLAARTRSAGVGGAGGATPGGGSTGSAPGSRTPTSSPTPGNGVTPTAPVRGGTPTTPAPATGGNGGDSTGVTPQAPGPVQQIIDDTRGIGESLPAPLGPTTGRILDSLLGNTAP
jgi:hypothetical protein